MKFALVSHVLPPAGSGQAMLIYRLLKDLDPDEYCLISQRTWLTRDYLGQYSETLPGKHYQLPLEILVRGLRFGGFAKWRMRMNLLLGTATRGLRIARIARRERCEAIVALTGHLLDLPAAYLASRLVRVPFYAYILDYYSAREWGDPVERLFAERVEPILLKEAAGIITLNEFLHDALRRRYGVETTIIHNPCDLAQYVCRAEDTPSRAEDEIRIVYTGAVYDAHYDAFHNLFAALELLQHPNVRLHLYTSQSPSYLAEMGLRGPVVHHGHQPASAMPGIQQQADVLFLPLAFNSPYPELIRTSAPFKMGEYLAARRPVLAHAPPDSFVAWYFRQHDCGVVVDQRDPATLARAIEWVISDASLRQRLSANAWERAKSDFSISIAQSKFAGLLKLAIPERLRA